MGLREQLADAIERVVRKSRPGSDDDDSRAISDIVGPLSILDSRQSTMTAEAIDEWVRTPLLLRSSDPITLRQRVFLFVDAALPPSSSLSSLPKASA